MAKRAVFLLVAMAAAAALGACQPSPNGPTNSVSGAASASAPAGSDLTAAASGLCQAMAALPDADAAERAFDNRAHEALHALAAAPGLDRDLSAGILESMESVERDFATSHDSALGTDLNALARDADAALRALGQSVSPCE
jgi:uncharacterized protein YggE